MHDSTVPLEKIGKGRYSEIFLRAMDLAMSVKPEHRPQKVAELRALLMLDAQPARIEIPPLKKEIKTQGILGKLGSKGVIAGLALATIPIAVGVYLLVSHGSDSDAPVAASSIRPATPVTPIYPAASELQSTAKQPVLPVSAQVLTATLPFNPMDALDQLFEHREQNHIVTVGLDKPRLKIGKDKFRFRVMSTKPGYLYILMLTTNKQHLNLLFPNALDGNNKIKAGKEVNLPRKGWAMTADGPAGTDHFVVMVSEHPRDFRDAGLINDGPFGEFPLEYVAKMIKPKNGDKASLSGNSTCISELNCSTTYGAARFSVDEIP